MPGERYKVKDMVAALHASKGMVYVAARQLGCAANTIYNYAKRHQSVQDAIDFERGMMLDVAEIALWKAIQNGEGWAISLALRTIGRSRGYIEKIVIEGGVPVELINETIRALVGANMSASDIFHELIREAAEQQSVRPTGDSEAAGGG